MHVVYLVVPCYNEEEVLPLTNSKLTEKLEQLISAGKADEKKPHFVCRRRQQGQNLGADYQIPSGVR